MATITVAYDPFARAGLERESHIQSPGNAFRLCCEWCGNDKHVLYSYTPERPAFRVPQRVTNVFCNLDCYRSYHA